MARLCAVANGNNTDAATWALIDSTSFNESESSSATVPTIYSTSYTQFTPGAITIDGIGIRLANRSGTTGTFSVELYNHTAGASVAGTEVTIDCSDFNDALTSSLDGGWYFFKFSSSVTLLAANNYSVRFKTSNSAQISFHGSSVTNPSRFLRTTTTQAPVAGDDRYVMGEWTSAGSTTTRTVTLDDTVDVDYGSGSTSIVTPALSINAGGIVLAGTGASTTYIQKISGTVVVYNGGVLRIATSGSRMPSTSSFTWTFDCVANVDFGINVRRKGEFTAYGEDKQRWTLLTGDEAIAQTVIGIQSTTGWKANDVLMFAPTARTTNQYETKTISTVDSSTQVTLSAGLTFAHAGTGDVIGEVGNLTSNVKIVGISSAVGTYITFYENSIGVLDNVEVQFYGAANASKRGVESQHTSSATNTCTFSKCAFRDQINVNSAVAITGSASGNYYINDNVLYNSSTSGSGITLNQASLTSQVFEVQRNLIVSGNSGTGMTIQAYTGPSAIIADNRIAGCNNGVNFSPNYNADRVTTISGFKVHTCGNTGININGSGTKYIENCDFLHMGSTGGSGNAGLTVINSCNFIGNNSTGFSLNTPSSNTTTDLIFNSCVFRGSSGFNQPNGILGNTSIGTVYSATFNSCTFGSVVAHTTADVSLSSSGISTKMYMNSCTFLSTNEFITNIQSILFEGLIAVQRKDDIDGNHVTYIREGIITPDTTIFRTASPSLRIRPTSATEEIVNTKFFDFKVPVNNGQTCTPSLYVRESVVGDGTDYNGDRVKLYVKANINAGIMSDTLLDTATISSEGAWEQLTGTTAAVTDDCVLHFYVTCNGTTGWINIDDFTATTA